MKKSIIKIKSSAKINLYLNVSRRLRGDGYHEIKSIMQSVGLFDEVTFEVQKKTGDAGSPGRHNCNGIEILCDNGEIPLDEKNHVHQAALKLLEAADELGKYEIKISIKKKIPVSAGLAGGSSNAAATLVALNNILNLGFNYNRLHDVAGKVGADVPFCLKGGTALAEGKGEILTFLPDLPFYWVVLAVNGKRFLSRDIYRSFDEFGIESKQIYLELKKYITDSKYGSLFKKLTNDLESVAIAGDNMIKEREKTALELGAIASMMTGSGPTVFALSEDYVTARNICEGLKPISEKVFLTHTTNEGITIA